MLQMETGLTILLLAVGGIAIVWRWARSPYHHRGIRPGEFPDFFKNLLRDADGSKMMVRDERTAHSIVVEKTYSDKEEVLFELHLMLPGEDASALQRDLQDELAGASLEVRNGSMTVSVRDVRPTAAASACRVLRLLFGRLGSTAENSYHIYFDARPDDEASRDRFESLLKDPDASDFRKEVATRALATLDKKLERKKKT